MNGPISIAWNSYQSDIVPGCASDTQIRETKLAFHAGAISTLAAIIRANTEDDMERIIKTMSAEMNSFVTDVAMEG